MIRHPCPVVAGLGERLRRSRLETTAQCSECGAKDGDKLPRMVSAAARARARSRAAGTPTFLTRNDLTMDWHLLAAWCSHLAATAHSEAGCGDGDESPRTVSETVSAAALKRARSRAAGTPTFLTRNDLTMD